MAYLCALLNSRLLDFYFKHVAATFHGGYFAANKQFIEQLPVRPIDFSHAEDNAQHDRMVRLVEQVLEAKKELAKAQTDKDKNYYGSKCAALDQQIDRLVYDLYGLTESEITIVEGSVKAPAY
jgi:hypothetical protein